MGQRRYAHRAKDDDQDELSKPHTATLAPHPDTIEGRLLTWQQSYGNKAVTTAIQRKGEKGKGKAPATYFPTESHPEYGKDPPWDEGKLAKEGTQFVLEGGPNAATKGVEMLIELYFRTKRRELGLNISRGYKVIGDEKRRAFWSAVFAGDIKEYDPSKEHA